MKLGKCSEITLETKPREYVAKINYSKSFTVNMPLWSVSHLFLWGYKEMDHSHMFVVSDIMLVAWNQLDWADLHQRNGQKLAGFPQQSGSFMYLSTAKARNVCESKQTS